MDQKNTGGNALFGDFDTCACHNDYGFYPEKHFKEMLSRERKRTERSANPFVLILVDVGDLLERSGENFSGILAVRKILECLGEIIRETDIRGWYQERRLVGVMFLEIGELNETTLVEKVRKQIQLVVGGWAEGQVEISAYSFPVNESNSSPEILLTFYPPRNRQKVQKLIKRVIDITGSSFAILLFSPLFITLPLLIKLTSRGPVFFKQQRVGQRGRIFTLLKFRSMFINSDESIHKEYVSKLIRGDLSEQKVYKIRSDPRVTPLGRFLRKTSLDEFPQFFNVLKGDMSLVGPRPPISYETEQYDLWHLRRIMEFKPGITGFWQVEGRSTTTFEGMVRMDLSYCRKQSVLLDLKLILKTPLALLSAKGAY